MGVKIVFIIHTMRGRMAAVMWCGGVIIYYYLLLSLLLFVLLLLWAAIAA